MKKFNLFAFFLLTGLMVISCTKSAKDEAAEMKNKYCDRIKNSFTSTGLRQIKKESDAELNKKKLTGNAEFMSYWVDSLQQCFRTVNYSKNIQAMAFPEISGDAASYLRLSDNNMKLELMPENLRFVIKAKIKAVAKISIDSITPESYIEIIDNNGNTILNNNIYLPPNITKLMRTGAGESWLEIPLLPLFNDFANGSLDSAASNLEKIEKAAYFRLTINTSNGNAAGKAGTGGKSLEQLEKDVAAYETIVKKALDGDLKAMASYKKVYDQAEEKLKAVQSSNLSPLAMAKLNNLKTRLNKANLMMK